MHGSNHTLHEGLGTWSDPVDIVVTFTDGRRHRFLSVPIDTTGTLDPAQVRCSTLGRSCW